MFKITNLMIYLWAKGKVVYKYNPVNAKTDINPQLCTTTVTFYCPL